MEVKTMTITDSQLETWTKVPPSTKFKDTYEAVKKALVSVGIFPEGSKYDVYLQGSYACTTHIKEDSDVDVVVELTTTYRYDISRLSAEEKAQYEADRVNATYVWEQFRQDVLNALRKHFGTNNVVEGNKSIKVYSPSSNLYADIVVCEQYRQYLKYRSASEYSYYQGIIFWTRDTKEQVVNFPKYHIDNGSEKNKLASEYKASVRMFKNIKRELVDSAILDKAVAPSYFVECLLYNVPNNRFGTNRRSTIIGILDWFHTLNDAGKATLLCQNGIVPLFGSSKQQWSYDKALKYMWGVMELIK
jgi:hypothetical protein